jgi:hypothetical protein
LVEEDLDVGVDRVDEDRCDDDGTDGPQWFP